MVIAVTLAGPVGCGTKRGAKRGAECGAKSGAERGPRSGARCGARGDEAGRGSRRRLLDLPRGHVCGRAETDIETGSFVYRACVVP